MQNPYIKIPVASRVAQLAVLSNGIFMECNDAIIAYRFLKETDALIFACNCNYEKLVPKIEIGKHDVILHRVEV